MKSLIKNIYIDQGSSFNETITVVDASNRPVNMEQYEIYAVLKKHYESVKSISFCVDIVDVNKIVLTLDAITTSSLSGGQYVYDIIVMSDDEHRERIQEGQAIVTPGVTL